MYNSGDASKQKQRSLKTKLIIGALSGCGAVTHCLLNLIRVHISNPLEVVKTRMQLQGELQKHGVYVAHYRGLVHAFYIIMKNEGIKGIQKGLALAYPYTVVMNGTRLGMYEPMKTAISSITSLSRAVAGAISGIIGSSLANPFYIAKTRLQSYSPLLPVGHQHAYTGALSAMSGIYKDGGIQEFWRGTKAACIRISVASPAQLVCYDNAKRIVLSMGIPDGLPAYLLSGTIAGICLSIALNPFDVVTTRLYNQKYVDGVGTLYKGWVDCFASTLRTEGIHGLYPTEKDKTKPQSTETNTFS